MNDDGINPNRARDLEAEVRELRAALKIAQRGAEVAEYKWHLVAERGHRMLRQIERVEALARHWREIGDAYVYESATELAEYLEQALLEPEDA